MSKENTELESNKNTDLGKKISSTNKSNTENIKYVIEKVEENIKIYKRIKGYDKRTLLELYGFALNLCREISDTEHAKMIEEKILKILKTFLLEELRVKHDIELANLSVQINLFKAKLKNIKLKFNASTLGDSELFRETHVAIIELIQWIFGYIQSLLKQPPGRYTIMSLGSLATGLMTPYSDIEYFILVENSNDENRIYFENFSDLFDFMIISFGESSLHKARTLLEQLGDSTIKEMLDSMTVGMRVDEHKKPQDINRLIGLINTSEGLLKKIPTNIIHQQGNHLTIALLGATKLWGDEKLYFEYTQLFERVLSSFEYLDCLRKINQQDIHLGRKIQLTLENNILLKSKEKYELKPFLAYSLYVIQGIGLLLKSSGEKMTLRINPIEMLEQLKGGSYINETQAKNWRELINILVSLRLDCQKRNHNSESKIHLEEMELVLSKKQYSTTLLCKRLQEITLIAENYLNKNKENTLPMLDKILQSRNCITWKLPRHDNLFVGRKDLLELLHRELNLSSTLAISACVGLGGIGKTQLVLQYIYNTPSFYNLKAWFSAENSDQLKQKMMEFAKELGFKEAIENFEKTLIFVKKWLSEHPGWLLVFDNVNNYAEIKDYLPEKGGCLILTTRDRNWPTGFKVLDINLMSESESLEVIRLITKREIEKELKETKELAKTLGYLPLALAQASAYIRECRVSIQQYLKLYKEYELTLLADTTLPEGTNSLPVAAIWNLSLSAILKETTANHDPKLTLDLLTLSSYLSAENIPRSLLNIWFQKAYPNRTIMDFNKCLGQLWRYSLINYEGDDHITVHRLVQTVVRHQHQKSLTLEWYNTLLMAINDEFSGHKEAQEEYQKNLFPHMLSGLKYYDLNFSKQPLKCLIQIFDNIALVFFKFRNKEALNYYKRSLDIKEKEFGKEHEEVAETLLNLGNAYGEFGHIEESKKCFERALIIRELKSGKDSKEVASILSSLGNVYGELGESSKARKFFERALSIQERHFEAGHPEILRSLRNLSVVYQDLGEANESIKILEQIIKIEEKKYGSHHVRVASILVPMGNAYGDVKDAAKQKESLERALAIYEREYTKDHIKVSFTLTSLGEAYRVLEDLQKSKTTLERALLINEMHYTKDHHETSFTLHNLGKTLTDLGEVIKSKEHLERALSINKRHYGEKHAEVGKVLFSLAKNYFKSNDIQNAYVFAQKAYAIFVSSFGTQNPKTIELLQALKDFEPKSKAVILSKPCKEGSFLTTIGNSESYCARKQLTIL